MRTTLPYTTQPHWSPASANVRLDRTRGVTLEAKASVESPLDYIAQPTPITPEPLAIANANDPASRRYAQVLAADIQRGPSLGRRIDLYI